MKFLKQIIEIWRGKTFIDSVMNDFVKMMKEVDDMFITVTRLLFEKSVKTKKAMEKKVYEEDILVNKAERRIRKRVAEHLSCQAEVDVAACLVMMSIVKDVERIGDYCKNLVEVYEMLKKSLSKKDPYYNEFLKMRDEIRKIIEETTIAFKESLVDNAKEVMNIAYKIEKKCDSIIQEIAKSKMETNRAVCLVLMARYFKRISAHLSNIASAVIYPVHRLDYYYKNLNKENKK